MTTQLITLIKIALIQVNDNNVFNCCSCLKEKNVNLIFTLFTKLISKTSNFFRMLRGSIATTSEYFESLLCIFKFSITNTRQYMPEKNYRQHFYRNCN